MQGRGEERSRLLEVLPYSSESTSISFFDGQQPSHVILDSDVEWRNMATNM